MNRTLLEKPFDPGQIRRRQGRNGMLAYVEGHSVIQRLNDALEGAWSFEIAQHEVREDEVIVLGKLTAGPIAKMAFGASHVTRERAGGAVVSLGDDLKAAATDALKKCATFLGVGLHLYAEKPLGGPQRPAPGGTATARTILRVGRARGLTPVDLEGMSTRAFGRKPGLLTRAEASTLIKELTTLRRPTA